MIRPRTHRSIPFAVGRVAVACVVLGVAETSIGPGAHRYIVEGQEVANDEQGSVLYGTIFDSLRSAPLADAVVALWDTPHRTRSDESGRYRLSGIEPGAYLVAFFHPHMAELGVSSTPRRAVVAGDSVRVDLATPSALTVAVAMCGFEERDPEAGVVVGRVSDALTGVNLPDVRVKLSWERAGDPPESVTARTDGDGHYMTCQVPVGGKVLASATFLDRSARVRWFDVPATGGAQADLAISRLEPSTVEGTVTDAATGRPVADVSVWLGGTAVRTLTDGDGRFALESVVPGDHGLLTDHLAYATRSDALTVPEGSVVNVQVGISQRPIELPGIQVEIEAISTSERAAGGIHITRSQIERVRHLARDIGDFLRSQHIPGIIVRRRSDGSLCLGSAQGQVRMMNNPGCVPMLIFVNGTRATNSDLALRIPPDAVDRMVVYKPVEAGTLFGMGSGNGVLMIYTKGN